MSWVLVECSVSWGPCGSIGSRSRNGATEEEARRGTRLEMRIRWTRTAFHLIRELADRSPLLGPDPDDVRDRVNEDLGQRRQCQPEGWDPVVCAGWGRNSPCRRQSPRSWRSLSRRSTRAAPGSLKPRSISFVALLCVCVCVCKRVVGRGPSVILNTILSFFFAAISSLVRPRIGRIPPKSTHLDLVDEIVLSVLLAHEPFFRSPLDTDPLDVYTR